MESVNLPKGLIRYASEENIAKGKKFTFTPRLKGYTAVLVILIGVLTGMLFLRNDVEADVLRLPGQLFEHKEGDIISNVFTYKLVNKTTRDIDHVNFKLISHKGTIKVVGKDNFTIPKEGLEKGTLFIEIRKRDLEKDKEKVKIGVYSGDQLIETTTTTFLGPRKFN